MSVDHLPYIQKWVKTGARVLDLGCGDGGPLMALVQQHKVDGLGIEIDNEKITSCLEKGLCVVQQDLNLGLNNFDNHSFDLVLMTYALQETKAPDKILREMVRVGKQVIVSIPNMGYWRCRWQIAVGGHMPIVTRLPNHWYDSENIHLCTLKDFEQLCRGTGIKILERILPPHTLMAPLARRISPLANFLADSASYRLSG